MIQVGTAGRNAMLAALIASIGDNAVLRMFTGSIPATNAAASTGTLLIEIDLPSEPFAAPTAGSAEKAGTWSGEGLPAAGTGTAAGYFRIFDDEDVCHYQGTISAPGNGGDMILVNTSIAENQPTEVGTFTITDGNGPA